MTVYDRKSNISLVVVINENTWHGRCYDMSGLMICVDLYMYFYLNIQSIGTLILHTCHIEHNSTQLVWFTYTAALGVILNWFWSFLHSELTAHFSTQNWLCSFLHPELTLLISSPRTDSAHFSTQNWLCSFLHPELTLLISPPRTDSAHFST